jgi:hypothetical protein
MGGMPTFHRVVKSNPPSERDFLSMRALGRRLRNPTPENLYIYDGVSVTRTADGARSLVGDFPQMGRFIAVLEIEDDGPIRVEQTGTYPEHYTLWGSAEDLLARVTSVMSV